MAKTLRISFSFLLGLTLFLGAVTQVSAQCHAKFSFSKTELTATFSDSSYSTHDLLRFWYFGDGGKSDAKNPKHVYTKAGSYRVCLYVYDTAAKCKDSFCETVTVKPSCKSEWTYIVSGKIVYFIADSSVNSSKAKYRWVFGDGSSSVLGKKLSHTFSGPGTYEVCLTVVDSPCEVKTCKSIVIQGPCTAKWEFSVSGKTVTFRADTSVNKSSAKYRWKFGDGSSIVTGKTATHSYSTTGTFEACLTVVDSPCESKLCKNVVIAAQKYCISGKIDCGGDPAYPGKVWLIVYNPADTSLKAVRDGKIKKDSTGTYYEFCDVEPGKYYVKAALDTSSSNYEDYAPTYFENSTKWKHADSIVVKTANVTGKNIHMKKGNNPGGPGFIKGRISEGANKMEGDPMVGIEVMLLDNATEQPVEYTYTNLDGEYSFTSLAMGTYQVYPEVIGLPTFPAIVTLSTATPGVQNIDMKINSTTVYAATAIAENIKGIQKLNLYPNPAQSSVYLPLVLAHQETLSLAVYDAAGRKVYTLTQKFAGGSLTITVPVAAFAKGLYTVQMRTGSGQLYESRFVKE